jgi:hypothetical protein
MIAVESTMLRRTAWLGSDVFINVTLGTQNTGGVT